MVMKRIMYSFIWVGLFVIWGCVANQQLEEPNGKKREFEDLSPYFEGVNGTFVLFSESSNIYTIYNAIESEKPVPPCSTFKIIHSLIGLDTQVISDEQMFFAWDGRVHSFESWNQNHTLSSAMQHSVVWVYQKIAAQIGEKRMKDYLEKINYGNQDVSAGLTQFWLNRSLKISPIEQVEILKKMIHYQLPFSAQHIDTVKKIIKQPLLDSSSQLFGKTGSGFNSSRTHFVLGWYVGFVEKNKERFVFATRIESPDSSNIEAGGQLARHISIQILRDKGIL